MQESLPRVILLLTLIVVIILVACAAVVAVFAAPQGELLLQDMYFIDDVGYFVSTWFHMHIKLFIDWLTKILNYIRMEHFSLIILLQI